MDTEWFEATCIINLREEKKHLNMKQPETEKPHKTSLLSFKGKIKEKISPPKINALPYYAE